MSSKFLPPARRAALRRLGRAATHFDPGLRELRAAATAMAAVLAAYGATLWLEHAAHLHVDLVITAVVLAATLARTQRGADPADRLVGLLALAAASAAASEVGSLLIRHSAIGDTVFALAVAATIWIRRFGRRATKAGTVLVIPFIGLLVTHAQGVPPYGADHDLWAAVVGVFAAVCVALCQWGAACSGFSPADRRRPRVVPANQASVGGAEEAAAEPGGADPVAPRRIAASTRMAAQMGTALGLAFVAGHLRFPDHWPWVVLTAFIVCSGARGRGDVLHKGVLRAVGAAAGTLVATWIAGSFPPDDVTSVVIIFTVLGFAIWLRQVSYVYWAGSVTAVLSLLYGYFGESAPSLLRTRLEEIAIGAVLGIAASWFVLPVRTKDVLRRRLADVLAAVSDVLAAGAGPVEDLQARRIRFAENVYQLELLSKTLVAQRVLSGLPPRSRRDGRPHRADAIGAVRRIVEPVRDFAAVAGQADRAVLAQEDLGRLRAAVAGNVGAVRRAIGGREGTPYRRLPAPRPTDGAGPGPADGRPADPDRRRVSVALRAIDRELAALDRIYPAAADGPAAGVAASADPAAVSEASH